MILLIVALLAAAAAGWWLSRATHSPAPPAVEPALPPEVASTTGVEQAATPAEPEQPVDAPADLPPVDTGSVAIAEGAVSNEAAPAAPPAPTGVTERAAETPAPAPAALDQAAVLAEADALATNDRLVEARAKYLEVLPVVTNPAERVVVEDKVARVSIELIRTPRLMPEKVEYIIQPGDALARIAQKYGTTMDLIQESNLMTRPDLIKAGTRLRIFTGKLALTVSKGRNELLLTVDGRFLKRYRVGTGKFGTTPAGTFAVSDRVKEPIWWRTDGATIPFGDPENILGTRWLALKATGATADIKGYGVHGTWDNDSIGKAESAGCIRLKNEDVEELYLLAPIGAPVTIEE
jgi:lipoprotein-anchoring transpeptidase ErfK/SrfK